MRKRVVDDNAADSEMECIYEEEKRALYSLKGVQKRWSYRVPRGVYRNPFGPT